MNHDDKTAGGTEHEDISALLPWYVNGSIDEHDRARVEAHSSVCQSCRDDLAHELLVFRGMTAETSIEYMPAASLKRLQARLDGLDGEAAQSARAPAAPGPRRSMPWQGLMAASIAVMAVAVSLLAADRWAQARRHAAADYYTVTTPSPKPRDEVIRAVFSPTLTLVELRAILDESQLRIVSGPSEAGVYSLAATSGRPLDSSLALLRGHSEVRFAESTRPEPGPGKPP